MPIPRNKAIVGEHAFAHEAGIHQHGMLKHHSTYEIMRPQDVWLSRTNLVLGKHSGRHAFRERVKELGLELNDGAIGDEVRLACGGRTDHGTQTTQGCSVPFRDGLSEIRGPMQLRPWLTNGQP